MKRKGAPLKRGYLSKKGGQWLQVPLLELAVLLYCVQRAARDPNIGHNDARESLYSLAKNLGKQVLVDPNHLESALYAANLLDEGGKFDHPCGLSFDEMVKVILKGRKFNRRFSTIEGVGE